MNRCARTFVRYATCQNRALKVKYVGCVEVVNSGGHEVGVFNRRQKVSLSAEWLIWSSSLCHIYQIISSKQWIDVGIALRRGGKVASSLRYTYQLVSH